NDSITQAFGKPLAIATARKKLRITEGSGVRDQELEGRGQESGVRGLESEAREQESGITNQDFVNQDSGTRVAGTRVESVVPVLSMNSTNSASEWNAEAGSTATATLESSPWEEQTVSAPSLETSLRTLEIDLDAGGRHVAAEGPTTEPDLHLPKV